MKYNFELIAAPFTALYNNGEVNLDKVHKLATWYRANDINGVFINGTTGEGISLSIEERIALLNEWAKMRSGKLKVIAHVGHNSLPEAQKMARECERLELDGVSTIAPSFFKPSSPELLVQFCSEIARQTPSIPFYYYHMPSMTGTSYLMKDCLPLFLEEIPNFGGIKFTHENLFDFGQCVTNSNGRYKMFFGRDEILSSGLQLNADGAVGSFYNYFGKFFKQLIQDFYDGNTSEAMQKQAWIRTFCDKYLQLGANVATGKTIMKFCGIDCGPARLPLPEINEEHQQKIKTELEAIGFFEKILK